jgi:4-alpha-glucanotransferase
MDPSLDRRAGWLLPAFSVRRQGDLGIGDTAGMVEWINRAAASGVRLLQLLPINETGSGNSPYTTLSSMALEPLYLSVDPGWLPGAAWEDVAEAHDLLDEVISAEFIDYPTVRVAKRAIFHKAYERWKLDEARDAEGFEHFRGGEAGWLDDYAQFRWLMEEDGDCEAWNDWPVKFGTPAAARDYLASALASERGAAVSNRLGYYAWLQWVATQQWRRVREAADAAGVRLMGDVPIGISYHSADAFFEPRFFDLDWCGGAPPEEMFKHDEFLARWGQNWGVPLYRWDVLAAEDFSWWRRRVTGITRVFHSFRIDHVLGFYRIYSFPWQPQRNGEFLHLTDAQASALTGGKLPRWAPRPDDTVENQLANLRDGDLRLKALLRAAGGAVVVGEDLGCVPPYVRPHLASLGIAGFHIPHWEADAAGHVIPRHEIPYLSLTTYATHDHDPLAALWADARGDCGTERAGNGGDCEQLHRLLEFIGIPSAGEVPEYSAEIRRGLIKGLLDSGARDAVLMLADVFGWSQRFNMPGIAGGKNWRWRMPYTAASIIENPMLAGELRWLREAIAASRRT